MLKHTINPKTNKKIMKKKVQLLATVLITINFQFLTLNCVAQWTAVNTPNPIPQSLHTAVYFFDASKGMVVGSSPSAATGTISITNDAAQTWISPVVNTNGFFNDVRFPTVNTGYAVTILGEIVKSNDGGNKWTFQTSGTFNPLFGVNFIAFPIKFSNTCPILFRSTIIIGILLEILFISLIFLFPALSLK